MNYNYSLFLIAAMIVHQDVNILTVPSDHNTVGVPRRNVERTDIATGMNAHTVIHVDDIENQQR